MSLQKNTEELKLNKFFTDVNNTVIDSIYKPENLVVVNEGDVIYKTGDHSNELYLLLRGEVKLKFPSNNYISSKVFNDFFGEKELYDKTRRHSFAVANSNCHLYIIKKHIFETLIEKSNTIKKNIDTFGEVKLPEVSLSERSHIDIAKSIKPRLFRAIRSRDEEESDEQGQSVTEDFPPIDNSNIQLDDPSIKIENEIIVEEHDAESPNTSENDRNMFDEVSTLLKDDDVIKHESLDLFDTKKILAVLSSINSNINLYDTTRSIVEELLKFTSCEEGEVYLVDKNTFDLKKFVEYSGIISSIKLKNTQGLTGACAKQGKTINLNRPSKDSRFIAEIDQPGTKELNNIIYIPLLGQIHEAVGVLQLARSKEPFTDKDVEELELISGYAGLAIERCTALEKMIELENQKLRDGIEDFLKENLLIPINIINSSTSHLSKESFSNKIREMISLIRKQTNFIWDIFLSVFTYNKTEFKLNTERVNIADYMNSIIELLSDYCASRDINLFKKTSDKAYVIIDSGKLFLAVFQLIENACNVSEEDGKVFISSSTNGDYIQINVMDEGPGILDELKESLFTPGYSNSKGRNRFGLPIANKIIELHSGQLSYTKNAKVGSTFTIRIPIAKEPDEPEWENTSDSGSTSEDAKKD